jgi:hypothetical protein
LDLIFINRIENSKEIANKNSYKIEIYLKIPTSDMIIHNFTFSISIEYTAGKTIINKID